MGTWGAAVFRDDVAQDVRDTWISAYQKTRCPKAALQQVLASCAHEFKDEDDAPIAWLALVV